MKYGLTIENTNLAIEKAKAKADGCYLFRGFAYRVREGKITHYAHGGRILEAYGHFNCEVGQYEHGSYSAYGKKALQKIR